MSRRRFVLEVVKGRQRGRQLDVADDQVRVGRICQSNEGWLRFSDRSVSRDQAVFRWDDERQRYVLENRSDTNPTRVNGRVVHEKVLEDGDEISMGSVVLRVVGVALPARAQSAAARAPLRQAVPPRRQPEAALDRGSSIAQHGRVSRLDLARLLGQVGVMLRAGIPLARILDGMDQRGPTPGVRGLCARLLVRVVRGESLSQAMREQPDAFNALHVESVAAGERCGKLDAVLLELASWEERDLSLTRAVASALTYPLTVFVCGVLVVVLLGNKVIGALAPTFAQTGKPLPLITQVLFGASSLLQRPSVLLVGGFGLVLGLWGTIAWMRSPRGRRWCDGAMLALPLTGQLTRKLFVARFCNHLSLLYGSGIPLLSAITTSLSVSGNSCLRERVAGVVPKVREGERLAVALGRCGEFPQLALSLIAVGEDTARLDDMLGRLANIYDQEVYVLLEGLVKLLEPLVIAVMGALVGVMVLATLLPLYEVVNG